MRTNRTSTATFVVLALLAVLGVAGVNLLHVRRAPAPADQIFAVDVDVEGMHFIPDSVEVPAGKYLVIDLHNGDDQAHDLKVGDVETGRIEPGKSAKLNVGTVTKPIAGYCTIAGHKMRGMTFEVGVAQA